MATEGQYKSIPIESTVDHASTPLHRAIQVNGTIATTNTNAIGLLKSRGPIGAGVAAGVEGYMKAYAGAAITAGARLMVTTSGWIITATSGTIGIGKALETAASGDLFPGYFDFANALIS